jgi:hypothetical protein
VSDAAAAIALDAADGDVNRTEVPKIETCRHPLLEVLE